MFIRGGRICGLGRSIVGGTYPDKARKTVISVLLHASAPLDATWHDLLAVCTECGTGSLLPSVHLRYVKLLPGY